MVRESKWQGKQRNKQTNKERKQSERIQVCEASLPDGVGDELAAELDGGEEEGEVSLGLLELALVMNGVTGQGDQVGLNGIRGRHG